MRLEIGLLAFTQAGSHRNEQEALLTRRPPQVVRRQRRHQKELECGVVVNRHAAILEDERFLGARNVNLFGRKEHRRRRARANDFPERDIEVGGLLAVFPGIHAIVLGLGIVR